MLEPFDLPGMLVSHKGPNNGLVISTGIGSGSVFREVAGLDGNPNSVSLEAGDQKGCFVYSNASSVNLMCQEDKPEFKAGASFVKSGGLREYHPISFVAKGGRRNYLLEPLLNIRDESYTVYFNIGA